MDNSIQNLWTRVLAQFLEKSKRFTVRGDSKMGSKYVVAPSARSLAHCCRRISSRIGIPEDSHPSIDDIIEVCQYLDLLLSFEEINKRVHYEDAHGNIHGYFQMDGSIPPKLATGDSDFLRCTVANYKAFNRASMQDHMLGAESLAQAKLVRSRIQAMAKEEGLL